MEETFEGLQERWNQRGFGGKLVCFLKFLMFFKVMFDVFLRSFIMCLFFVGENIYNVSFFSNSALS